MSLSNENNVYDIRVPLGVVSADTTFEVKDITKKLKIIDFKVIDPTGVAEDGTNFVKVQLRRAAVVIAEHSTETTVGEGSLAAGVWATAPEKDIHDVLKGAKLDVNVDISGTGALTAGSVAMIRLIEV